MLEVIFDRFVRTLSSSVRNLSTTNTEIMSETIEATRFGIYLSQLERPSILGIIRAHEWDNHGLIYLDSELANSLFEALLGNRDTKGSKVAKKEYTNIEQALIIQFIDIIVTNLTSAFTPVTEVNFEFKRLETNPDLAIITRANNVSIVLKLNIRMNELKGNVEILLPYETIEPVREVLLQNFMGEKFGEDKIWEKHLSTSLWNTDLDVFASFPHITTTLYEILEWQVGTKIDLNTTPSDFIELKSGNHTIAEGKMGQKTGNIAVKLENIYTKEN